PAIGVRLARVHPGDDVVLVQRAELGRRLSVGLPVTLRLRAGGVRAFVTRGVRALVSHLCRSSSSVRRQGQPPIGALGLAPQKTRVPIIPITCTRTMFKTIDLAVAVPTPTGPPEAV